MQTTVRRACDGSLDRHGRSKTSAQLCAAVTGILRIYWVALQVRPTLTDITTLWKAYRQRNAEREA